MLKDTDRYNVLHNKYTTSDSFLPNRSIGTEVQAAVSYKMP